MIGNFLDVQASPVADMSRRVNDTSPLNGDGIDAGSSFSAVWCRFRG